MIDNKIEIQTFEVAVKKLAQKHAEGFIDIMRRPDFIKKDFETIYNEEFYKYSQEYSERKNDEEQHFEELGKMLVPGDMIGEEHIDDILGRIDESEFIEEEENSDIDLLEAEDDDQ